MIFFVVMVYILSFVFTIVIGGLMIQKNIESKEALPTLKKFHEVSWKLTETILASHVFPLGANYKVVPIHRLLEVMYVV